MASQIKVQGYDLFGLENEKLEVSPVFDFVVDEVCHCRSILAVGRVTILSVPSSHLTKDVLNKVTVEEH